MNDNRNGAALDEEKQFELSLRPTRLGEYIGQRKIKDNLRVFMKAALSRREALDHVLLFGPPGVGKCITPDSYILTAEGLKEFASLISESLTADTFVPFDSEIYGINGVEKTSHIYSNGVSSTIKIETSSGFQLEGTPNHPILVADSGGFVWKTLGQLGENDFVAISKGANCWGKNYQTAEWLSSSSDERRLRTESVIKKIHTGLTDILGRNPTVSELVASYGKTFEQGTKQFQIGIKARQIGLSFADGKKLKPKDLDYTFTDALPVKKKIVLDADLAYLLGVLIGDGNIEKGKLFPAFVITCEEKEIQDEIRRITEKHFGRIVKVCKYDGKAAELRFSQSIGKVVADFGIKAANAAEKSVPAGILQSPRDAVIGFLQGLFDADAYVRKDGLIDFGSRSKKLVFEVQLLLANLGIIGAVKKRLIKGEGFWRLIIGGENALIFHQKVGFRLSRKAKPGDFLQKTSRGWSKSELIPFASPLLLSLFRKSQPLPKRIHKVFDHVKRNDRTPTRQQIFKYISLLPETICNEPEFKVLAKLCDPHICWEKVKNLSEGFAEVYDFVVPESHSFTANGFVNHNTTLSVIVANEMGAELKTTAGPIIEKAGDLAAILTNLNEGDVLFIDEIHRLNPAIEEVLYPAMEDFNLDIMIGQGTAARSIKLELPKFTLVGATTRPGMITAPLRGRFGIVFHLDFYSIDDLATIIVRSAEILNVDIEEGGAKEIARRSRGTPRIANRLLRRVRDYAEVDYDGRITEEVAMDALNRMEVDTFGLDEIDRKLLLTIIEKFDGGPVGLGTISASIHEEKDSIEEIIEPYLIQIGFLNRTPRGRMATRLAYQHFGLDILLKRPEMPSLFE